MKTLKSNHFPVSDQNLDNKRKSCYKDCRLVQMGRKRKNNRSGGNTKKKGKRSHSRRKFWTENAVATKDLSSSQHHFLLIISRVALADDHHRPPSELEETLDNAKISSVDRNFKAEKSDVVKEPNLNDNLDGGHEQEGRDVHGDSKSREERQSKHLELDQQVPREDSQSFANFLDILQTRGATIDRAMKPSIAVAIDQSAVGSLPWKFQDLHYVDLPNGDCGDGIVNPNPPKIVANKYWAQRHRLFSKFDKGIQLDPEGWFSVTPEAIACHIANEIVSRMKRENASDLVVLDAFGGVGGNTIALALHPAISKVICVDTSYERLQMAANNCQVYDVLKEKVIFVKADAFEVLSRFREGVLQTEQQEFCEQQDALASGYSISENFNSLPSKVDSIFLSPPWGGVDYQNIGPRRYGLECIKLNDGSHDGNSLLSQATKALAPESGVLAYFLPRNTNGFSIGTSFFKNGYNSCAMEQHALNGKLKTIAVYGIRPASTEKDSCSTIDPKIVESP